MHVNPRMDAVLNDQRLEKHIVSKGGEVSNTISNVAQVRLLLRLAIETLWRIDPRSGGFAFQIVNPIVSARSPSTPTEQSKIPPM